MQKTYQVTDNYVSNKVNHFNKNEYPLSLDNRYGYLLDNGFYQYQEYINYEAKKAQEGNQESLEKCLYYFGWRGGQRPSEILGSFYEMLVYGTIDINKSYQLSFIRMFSNESQRDTLKGKWVSKKKNYIASKKIDEISKQLLSLKTEQEIYSDLIDIVMNRILNYKQGERTLRKYMYDLSYIYVVSYIQKTFKSAQDTGYTEVEYEDSFLTYDEYNLIDETDNLYYNYERENNELGFFWLQGNTHILFKDLTKTERFILRDSYYLGIPQREIANKFGVSRRVVRNRLKSAEDKIRKAYETIPVKELESNGFINFIL